ncbi:MAG: sigma-54 interaction domain-containing protein [Desulfatirhabdiaceae bacterium]
MDIAKHWKTIVDTLQDGLMVVDPCGNIVAVNPAAEKLTGYTADELIGSSCRGLNCTGCQIFAQGSGEKWCGLFLSGQVRAKQCMITSKSGRAIHVVKNASVLKDENGHIIGGVETFVDVSVMIQLQQEIASLRRTFHLDDGHHGILGKSPIMVRLFELIDSVAQSDAPVMIQGASGTGKELVARSIHETSHRKNKPFIKVNCASLNQNLLESELFGHVKGAYTGADRARMGRFEAAHEGTIFLDEIGDIPLATQVKLLRVLEEKEIERVGDHKSIPVNVRIVSATHKDLESLISQGLFREDLFFRINVFPLECPSLSDRREDIPVLVQHFIEQNNEKTGKKILGLTVEAMEKLMGYPWPGNVRELRNIIEYAFVLCSGEWIGTEHLPEKILIEPVMDCGGPVETRIERDKLLRVLRQVSGNQSEAARILDVSRVTIWKRIKKYGIDLTTLNFTDPGSDG